ncbi:MAG: DUF362 domain-containing protein, partial [Anaerolineae bacterium]|nr:DUF362 domain-containing protein [Anaerolineae bacterium]
MPHPTVALVRAAAEGEAFERVSAAVRRAVALAGGLDDVVRAGDTVLIKPNLVALPPTHPCGACTRPSVCRAVADLVAERGATPIIAESSARGVDTEAVMAFTGYAALRDLGYQVVDLKRTPTVVAPIPGGVALQQVVTYEPVLQADVIISAPVVKTHDQTDT